MDINYLAIQIREVEANIAKERKKLLIQQARLDFLSKLMHELMKEVAIADTSPLEDQIPHPSEHQYRYNS